MNECNSLLHLYDSVVQDLGLLDVEVEEFGSSLVADGEEVGEPSSDE